MSTTATTTQIRELTPDEAGSVNGGVYLNMGVFRLAVGQCGIDFLVAPAGYTICNPRLTQGC